MTKKIIYIILIFVFMVFVYTDQSAKDIPIEDIETSITQYEEISAMNKCSDRELIEFIGIDPSSSKGYFYYKGTDALSVNELLVIKLNDKTSLQNARDLVDARISSQIETFDGYGPKQVALLNNAVISQKGNYLMYYTGPHAGKYEEVFRNAL